MLLGIDAGVRNIGYALMDDNYSVIKIHGKRAIGTLKLSEADTAAYRRMNRTTRRRYDRRRFRIALLQEIFAAEINKKDPSFLPRLNENDLKQEDRSVNAGKPTIEKIYSLFNDKDYNDVKFYRQYPTIYHLRKALMDECPNDIRLLYLAVHHIVKYRGHFLLPGSLKNDGGENIKQIFERINELLRQMNEADEDSGEDAFQFKLDKLNDLKDLITGKGEITEGLLAEKREQLLANDKSYKPYIGNQDKKNEACLLLGVGAKDKLAKGLIKAIFGDKVNICTLFGGELYPKDEIKTFYLSDDLENNEDMKLLEDDNARYELIYALKEAYNWYKLNDLLKGSDSISAAMINVYETHKKDLKQLKTLIKAFAPQKYEAVFDVPKKDKKSDKTEKDCNYPLYIGGGRFNGIKIGNNGRLGDIGKMGKQEDFYKFIKKVLSNIDDADAAELKRNILDRIENKEFMPKIASVDNSAIPYQLNMLELDRILDKASESFAFLRDVSDGYDDDGKPSKWTNIDKIKSLLEFKIDYYVGPVKYYKEGEKSAYAWAVRRDEGRVTPWTYNYLIDKGESNEKFIKRMSSSCTYVKGAKALPKNSVIFSKYNCLNELNNLKINGEKIPVELKKEIFNAVYMAKNPTVKKLKNFLLTKGYDKNNLVLSGIDEKLYANMNTYLLYKSVLGDKADNEPKMIERLIQLSTIHTDSKIIEKTVKNEFSDKLTVEEIGKIKGFRFNGWSSLSAELLMGYQYNGIKLIYDGEYMNIVDIMYENNLNLQEIIAVKNSGFETALKSYYEDNGIIESSKIDYDYVKELYCSPSVKKCVWQSFKLVKDIIKQAKAIPDRIFIESSRTDKQKVRNKSRREIIENLYNDIKASDKAMKELLQDKTHCEKLLPSVTDLMLQSKKYYLYFMQLGKCMYSGEQIPFERINSGDYDIDHIYPQSKVKDDSFNNMVLVKKALNRGDKKDVYPLPPHLKQIALWRQLLQAKLITAEKYARLVRNTPITEAEKEKFINRQMVETNQTVVIIKDLLIRYLSNRTGKDYTDRIILSRARIVSDFRNDYDLVKLRESNDFHHAHDAYLNIVTGDILNKKYNKRFYLFNKDDNELNKPDPKEKSYNMAKTLSYAVKQNDRKILSTIRKELQSGDVRLVNNVEENSGELYNGTLYWGGEEKLHPIQESKIINGVETHPKCDTKKYGGYKTSGTAYFVLVDCEDKKEKKTRKFVDISIYENAKLQNDKITLEVVFKNKGLENAQLADIKGLESAKIKVGSLLEIVDKATGDKFKLNLAGNNGGKQLLFHNANPLIISDEEAKYIKEIVTSIEKTNKAVKANADKDGSKRGEYLNDLIARNIERNEACKQNRSNSGIGIEKTITVLSEEGNLRIYDLIIDKLSKCPYRSIPTYSELLKSLKSARDDFKSKNKFDQLEIITNCLKAFQCNPDKVDVSKLSYYNDKGELIKGKSKACSIVKAATDDWTIYLIRQSCSGLFEQKIRLN